MKIYHMGEGEACVGQFACTMKKLRTFKSFPETADNLSP